MLTRVERMHRVPLWSRVFGTLIALLIINLLWNDPLGPATGGASAAFVVLNILPSALAIWLIFRGARR